MANCILCETSEAVIGDHDRFNVVNCPKCSQYILTKELPSDPEWSGIRVELTRAVRWQTHSGRGAASVGSISEAKDLILCFEMDREDWEERTVQALTQAGTVPDPWGEPIRAVGKSLGMPMDEARAYVDGLAARGVVQIMSSHGGQTPEGMHPFPVVYWWEKTPADAAHKPGSKTPK